MDLKNLNASTFNLSLITALLFHFFGILGMMSVFREWFVSMTSLTLLIMAVLLVINEVKNISWVITFFFFSFFTGMLAEMIGVNFGWLFGDYQYTDKLGFQWFNVPTIIGVQWFVVTYSISNIINSVGVRFKYILSALHSSIWIKTFIAACMTTVFDIILEPFAIKLGYWVWLENGSVPLWNYFCWFGISAIFHYFYFSNPKLSDSRNDFAPWLIIIQSVFFIIVCQF